MIKQLVAVSKQGARRNTRSIIEMTINQEVLSDELQKRKGRSSP
ncbi:MAG: hypothetical protein K0R57_4844 [Paenibacillaceae bacterium]|jgi:hypothetical protein|nr:hypothetical protein [Paenibacillaceae bacterium]